MGLASGHAPRLLEPLGGKADGPLAWMGQAGRTRAGACPRPGGAAAPASEVHRPRAVLTETGSRASSGLPTQCLPQEEAGRARVAGRASGRPCLKREPEDTAPKCWEFCRTNDPAPTSI